MRDTTRHQGKRRLLAKIVEEKGITSKPVLDAIRKIPRHLFVDSSFEDHAYQDKAFPIAADQTISQPYTVAFQTELLEIKKGDSIWMSSFKTHGFSGDGSLLKISNGECLNTSDLSEILNLYKPTKTLERSYKDKISWGYE